MIKNESNNLALKSYNKERKKKHIDNVGITENTINCLKIMLENGDLEDGKRIRIKNQIIDLENKKATSSFIKQRQKKGKK